MDATGRRIVVAVALVCGAFLVSASGCKDDGEQKDGGSADARGILDGGALDTTGEDAVETKDDTSSPMPDGEAADSAATDTTEQADASSDTTGGEDGGSMASGCGELPMPGGNTETVGPSQAGNLASVIGDAKKGTTILLEDGTYPVRQQIHMDTEGVTLRSKSGDPSKVILSADYKVGEVLYISASDVTVAHLEIKNAENHAIHIVPPSGGPNVTGVRLYDLRLIDNGEQFIKINSPSSNDAWADDGRLECSHLEMTSAGRPNVERCCGGCYTGGIDAHGARGWVVRHNTFEGIYCAGEGLAEHAVHFWNASRDTTVEKNVIRNCARGIGFGLVKSNNGTRSYQDNPYPNAGYIGHYDGEIHNNFVYSNVPWLDTGIELDQARGAEVHHNTVYVSKSATQRFFSSIDYRFPNTDVTITNNLVQKITNRNGANGTVKNNHKGANATFFKGATTGDLHLKAGATDAIDKGTSVGHVKTDIDGDSRPQGSGPDIGADEYRP